jgi:hypothetical protein
MRRTHRIGTPACVLTILCIELRKLLYFKLQTPVTYWEIGTSSCDGIQLTTENINLSRCLSKPTGVRIQSSA